MRDSLNDRMMTQEINFSNLSDEDFEVEASKLLKDFMDSEQVVLHLPPMNSYFRRLCHKLAMKFNLMTESQGENHDRHIVVAKTQDSSIPADLAVKKTVLWHYGDREFYVDPLQPAVNIYLSLDGTVGVWEEGLKQILAQRKVTTPSFKIKNSQIVEIHDPEW